MQQFAGYEIVLLRCSDKGHICAMGHQFLRMLPGGGDFQNLHMDRRVCPAKSKERPRQQHRNRLVDAAYADVAQVGFGGVTNIGDRFFDIGEDPFGIHDEFRPGLGQADLPGCSEKQSGAKVLFQRRDPFRQGGLAKPQSLARAPEVKLLCDGDKAFQLPDVQPDPPCSFT